MERSVLNTTLAVSSLRRLIHEEEEDNILLCITRGTTRVVSIVRIVETRKLRWAAHVARKGKKESM
jgi:hypothetical protein